MKRSGRWLATCVATAVAFAGSLWLARVVTLPFEPHADSDRWAVAAGFAVAMSAAVMSGMGWWAGREPAKDSGASGEAPSSETAAGGAPVAGDVIDFSNSTNSGPMVIKGDMHIDHWRPSE